jgi:hypothetical protein
MHRFHQALLPTAIASLASCGPAHGPASRPATPRVSASVISQLTLPPRRGSGAALAQLSRGATCQAVWLRARYLLDLFDWVRLSEGGAASGDGALRLLWTGCGLSGTPGRGGLATHEVMAALRQRLASAGRACAGRNETFEAAAREGLELLAADGAGRGSVGEAMKVVVVYRRIASSGSALAPNARVRLVDWCAKAFRLAAGGDPDRQHRRLDHCLFPLFPAHPGPYFDDDPALRPPDPPWTTLQAALARARAGLEGTRLEALGARLKRADERFFSEAGARLPTPLRLDRFDLPTATAPTRPWDRTPVVVIGDKGYLVGGRAVLADDTDALEQAIAARLHNDDRRSVTIVANRSSLAERVLEVGRAARRAGALTLWLGVTRRVRDRPAAGDVQTEVFGKKPVLRLEGIPVSLSELGATRSGVSRSLPRGLGYDPRTARGRISLLVTREGVHLSSRDGRLTLASRVDGRLPLSLLELRQLYPGDRSVLLAPGRVTTYEDLVAVAAAVRHHRGQPLLPGIALVKPSQLASPEKDLAPVIRLLGRADVTMTPRVNRTWPDLAFRCYLDVLRGYVEKKGAPPVGMLRLRISARGPKAAGGTIRNRKLSRCVERVLEKAPKLPDPVKRITLSFSLKG